MENTQLPYLDDYKTYPPTEKCYLDGRYFNLIFQNYSGLMENPLIIKLDYEYDDNDNFTYESDILLQDYELISNQINIMRIIIESNKQRHSGVLILDIGDDDEIYNAIYFDSSNYDYKNIITDLISNALNLDSLEIIQSNLDLEKNKKCKKSGFCVAYAIKYAYDYILDRDFDPTEIRKFASRVEDEDKYNGLNNEEPDIEYDLGNAVAGGITAGLVGGAVGGLVASNVGVRPVVPVYPPVYTAPVVYPGYYGYPYHRYPHRRYYR